MSRFAGGPLAGPRQRGQLGPPRRVAASPGLDGQAHIHPEAVNREADAQPWADRSRGRAAFHAIVRWLRRVLADSARYWALAAGVPPDLYSRPVAAALVEGGEERPGVMAARPTGTAGRQAT